MSSTYAESVASCPPPPPDADHNSHIALLSPADDAPPPTPRRRLAFPDTAAAAAFGGGAAEFYLAALQLEQSYYRSKSESPPPPPPPPPARAMQCPCGRAPLALRRAAGGRWQYVCSARLKCSYSSWCDEVDLIPEPDARSPLKPENPQVYNSPGNQRSNAISPVTGSPKGASIYHQHPICSCGAGKCLISTRNGRKYYVCAIRQGQGACGHREPVDGPEEPPRRTPHYHPGEEMLMRYDPIQKETIKPNLHKVVQNNENRLVNSNPPDDEEWPFDFDVNGELIFKDFSRSSAQRAPNAQVVPEMPEMQHRLNSTVVGTLPMKGPPPPNVIGSPITPVSGTCFRCGREGHWSKNCTGSPASPCYRCGMVGHWAKDCTG